MTGAAKADIETNEITAMVTMSVTINKARKTFFLAVSEEVCAVDSSLLMGDTYRFSLWVLLMGSPIFWVL